MGRIGGKSWKEGENGAEGRRSVRDGFDGENVKQSEMGDDGRNDGKVAG